MHFPAPYPNCNSSDLHNNPSLRHCSFDGQCHRATRARIEIWYHPKIGMRSRRASNLAGWLAGWQLSIYNAANPVPKLSQIVGGLVFKVIAFFFSPLLAWQLAVVFDVVGLFYPSCLPEAKSSQPASREAVIICSRHIKLRQTKLKAFFSGELGCCCSR